MFVVIISLSLLLTKEDGRVRSQRRKREKEGEETRHVIQWTEKESRNEELDDCNYLQKIKQNNKIHREVEYE